MAAVAPVSTRRLPAPVAGLLAAGLVGLSGFAVPPVHPDGPPVVLAIVQGNVPRLGLDFNAQRRAVLDNHVRGTIELADAIRAGRAQQPDLVIWPENASDIDPLRNPDARARIDQAAIAIRAPILIGAVLEGPGDRVRNAGLLWVAGEGPQQLYVKRHPVPFAEYIPLRSLIRHVTSKVDLVRSDFVAGDTPGVLSADTAAGPVTVGDVICFEVAYDGVVRDTVTGGAGLIAVQTNNATFGLSAEAAQQLAMVRLRAVEHGRPALMASTTGISAFVDPDGQVHDPTRLNTRAVLVRQVNLGTDTTLATRVGVVPELVLSALAVLGLIAAAWLARVRRRGTIESEPASTGEADSTTGR